MKTNNPKLRVILLAAILIVFIPLVAAAPVGTSESAVVEEARSWIGVKDVHGGNDRSGIDCSHLVYQVYKEVGAKGIEFQTVPNMKKNKNFVTTSSPAPGDVIFWKKDVTQDNRTYWLAAHVGIYIGNSQFIHTDHTVTIDSISGVYKDGIPYYARWEYDSSSSNQPVAAFSASPSSGTAPLKVSFTDKSTGATSWSWTFGDRENSTEKNPVHTYSTAGSYRVDLTVSNENGKDSESATVTVQEYIAPPVAPVANFNAVPTSGYAPLTVQFTDLSENANAWYWDFGDGAYSSDRNPTHIYSTAGSYLIKLTVSKENSKDSKSATVTVQENVTPPIAPVANFNADITSGYIPLTVQFTDLSKNANSWYWDFGDGTASGEPSPSHTYSTAGNYLVNLTVRNENGKDSKFATVTVQEYTAPPALPVANFNANPTSGYAPLTVQFTDLSENANSWYWDLGDGTASTEHSPSHTYSFAGTYIVNLTVSNANGPASKATTITVQDQNNSGSGSDGGSSGGSSHSSGGGGGGGGAGGSPEPQSNVEAKELSQTFIASGRSVKFDFPRNATPVVYVSFDAKKTLGKTTTVAEMLKGKSALVPELPAGEVYRSINVWVGNGGVATPKNLENPVLCLKVEKLWMQNKSIDPGSIALNMYSDKKWEILPVNMSGEDPEYLYFTANVSGFSSFAITGTGGAKSAPEKQEAPENRKGDLPSIGTVQLTNDTNDTVIKGGVEKKVPGFEMVLGIVCLFAVFLYKRR